MPKQYFLYSTTVGISKAELRKQIRAERALRDTKISWTHILQADEFHSAQNIASYISYENEPNTADLNSAILRAGKHLLLPRLLSDNDLEWVLWDGKEANLARKSKHLEPKGEASQLIINFIIVPTLYSDRLGNRLGQGGGSYDRALPKLNAFRIGLIYAGELSSDEIPHEPHDSKLNAVATPDLIIRFN